jgi:signal transduction histidine kinase/ActR/RegA family two-component response regulator
MSIRRRLLLVVLLAMLPPTLLVAVRFFQDYRKQIDTATVGLTLLASSLSDNLDEKIQGTSQLLYGLARAPELETSDRAYCSSFLSAVREEYPLYTGVLTLQPDGRLFCDSLATGRTLDLSDRRYYRQIVEGAPGVVLEPAFGRLTGLAVLQIAFPIRAADGSLQRILLASLNLTGFLQSNAQKTLVRDAEVMIVDRRGTLLARQSRAETAQGDSKADPAVKVDQDIQATELFGFALAHPRGGVAELTGLTGGRQVWAVAPVRAERDPGVFILAGRSVASLVDVEERRLVEDLMLLGVFSVVLMAIVWLIAEHGIRRPVGRIATTVSRLGRGELDARVEAPHPRGELGTLMAAVNTAAASLESQRADIVALNDRLRQAQKMEAIGQLTGGIAHDFNNLLTVILGNSELLSDKLRAHPLLKRLADMSKTAAERGADLTRNLLAFARRQPLNPRTVDVNELLRRMQGILTRTLGELVECRFAPGERLWPARIDPTQLETAVLNLAINARHAMEAGGRLVIQSANATLDEDYCRANADAQPGDYVMIAVTDNGSGMSADVMAKAFDPFFTTKGVGKGSGLDLSMVYGFVKQSNGHVRIESALGHGTTVTLYLPRAAEPVQPAASTREAVIHRGAEVVLVVEDEDIVREHVVDQVAGLGYRTLTARDATEALAILRAGAAIDLLFTDVVMPGGMSGPELAQEALRLRPGLRVLYTSGYTDNAVVNEGLEGGVQLLSKPYRRHELAEKLRAALERRADSPKRS